jgi:hypothetical protein
MWLSMIMYVRPIGSTRVGQGEGDRLRGVLHRVNRMVSYVYMSVSTLTANGQVKKIHFFTVNQRRVSYMP